MSVYKGSSEQEDIYVGDTKISEVYKGSSLVYNSYQEPWYKSDNSGYGYKFCKAGDASLTNKGTYNKKTLMIRGGLYSIIDGYVWYNAMTSRLNIGDVNFVNYNSFKCFFKNGNLYTANNTTYTSRLSGGWSKGSWGSSSSSGGNWLYALKNKELYLLHFNSNNTLDTSTKIMDINNDIIFPRTVTSKFLIIDNKLYTGFNVNTGAITLLDNTGIWTCCSSKFGIKDGKIYQFNTDDTMKLVDDSKTWINLSECQTTNYYYALANDGTLALLRWIINNSFNIELNPIPELKGRWEKFTNTQQNSFTSHVYKVLAIRNGALYALDYDKSYILLDDTKYYTEVDGDYRDKTATAVFLVAVYSGNRILA